MPAPTRCLASRPNRTCRPSPATSAQPDPVRPQATEPEPVIAEEAPSGPLPAPAQPVAVRLNVGCIPSEALLRNAELAHIFTKEAKQFGIGGEATRDSSVRVLLLEPVLRDEGPSPPRCRSSRDYDAPIGW